MSQRRLPVACSTATVAVGLGGLDDPLEATLKRLRDIPADGFELVLFPQWAADVSPPLLAPTETGRRYAGPGQPLAETVAAVRASGLPVPSVHAHRDLGILLTSGEAGRRRQGRRLLERTVGAAAALGAAVVVVHGWDTYAPALALDRAVAPLRAAAAGGGAGRPRVAVENVPVSAPGSDQVRAVGALLEAIPDLGFCLDLSWSSLEDNLDRLLGFAPRLANVHVQGRWDGRGLVPRYGNLDLAEALDAVLGAGYRGPLTLELNRPLSAADFDRALEWVRRVAGGG